MLDCSPHIYSFLHLCASFVLLCTSAAFASLVVGRCELTRVPTCPCVSVCVQTGRIRFQCLPVLAFTEPRAPTLCLTNLKTAKSQDEVFMKKKTILQCGITPFLICNSKGVHQGSNHNQTYTDVYRQNKEQKGLKALMSVLPRGSESMKHEGIGLLHTRNALHNQTLCHMGQKREGKSGTAVC